MPPPELWDKIEKFFESPGLVQRCIDADAVGSNIQLEVPSRSDDLRKYVHAVVDSIGDSAMDPVFRAVLYLYGWWAIQPRLEPINLEAFVVAHGGDTNELRDRVPTFLRSPFMLPAGDLTESELEGVIVEAQRRLAEMHPRIGSELSAMAASNEEADRGSRGVKAKGPRSMRPNPDPQPEEFEG